MEALEILASLAPVMAGLGVFFAGLGVLIRGSRTGKDWQAAIRHRKLQRGPQCTIARTFDLAFALTF